MSRDLRTTGRHLFVLLFLALFLAGIAASPAEAVRSWPKLQNGTLTADNGELLRGIFWDTDRMNGQLPDPDVVEIMKDYGFNTLHVYAEQPCPSKGHTPGMWLSQNIQLRDLAKALDLYLVITIGGACKEDVEFICLSEGVSPEECRANPNLYDYEVDTFDKGFAVGFWKKYAKAMGNNAFVIFEINNEPWYKKIGDFVYAQNPPQKVIDLQAEAYRAIRVDAAKIHSRVLLFSYGGFVNDSGPECTGGSMPGCGQAKDDWNRVKTKLSQLGSVTLDNKTGVAFHTYFSGNISQIRQQVQAARSGSNALTIVNTEVDRHNICPVGNPTGAEWPCLYREQHQLWEEEEISWLSFLKVGRIHPDTGLPVNLYDEGDYEEQVVAPLETGDDVAWIPDDPSAAWPVERATIAGGTTNLCGSRIHLRSVSETRYVKTRTDDKLAATSTSAGSNVAWYDVVCSGYPVVDGSKKALLRAVRNGKFVDPGWTSTGSLLIANVTIPTNAQLFEVLKRRDGSLVLRSAFFGARPSWRFISVDPVSKFLYDNHTVVGAAERFTYGLH